MKPFAARLRFAGIVAAMLATVVLCARAQDPPAARPGSKASGDAVLRIYQEAIERIRSKGLLTGPFDPEAVRAAGTLKSYLHENDPYGDFLTPEEYARFQKLRSEQYAGVGLELERGRDGKVYCFPDADGPSAAAGVVAGDRLLEVEGQPVGGLALPTLAAMAAGNPGSMLNLEVSGRGHGTRHVSVARRRASGPSVVRTKVGPRTVLRVAAFSPATRQELDFLVSTAPSSDPLILDLRRNRGGDLNAAIDCAMLFLDRGQAVLTVRAKDGTRSYFGSGMRPAWPRRVILWQDSGTASAAEVFIAALTENGRGVSMGEKTFGKGTRQEVFELESGAALILTTGYLVTPHGREIDKLGLKPTYPVSEAGPGDAAYLQRLEQLLASPS